MDNRVDLSEYYSRRNEDNRLESDKRHKIEKIIINEWIHKYIKVNDKILETGAGTGAYAIELAKEGYEVHALELLEKNMNCLKNKINTEMKITTILGDARDLSIYEDNTFNMVLCLGPMYHLKSLDDRNKCIEESIRVCKPKGIIFFEYISNDFTFSKNVKKINNYIINYADEFNSEFEINNKTFVYINPTDFEKNIQQFGNIEKLHHIGIDGVSSLIEDKINSMTNDEFEIWLNFLRKKAEKNEQIGCNENILYIGQKK